MEMRKRSMLFALVLALGGGLAACQTGYDQEPGRDAGSQTGEIAPPEGGAAGSTSGGASGEVAPPKDEGSASR